MNNPIMHAISLAFLAAAPHAAAQTAADRVALSYTVVVDRAPPQAVEVRLAPSARHDVALKGGYTLSFARNGDAPSVRSELKTSDGRVLHTRQGQTDGGRPLRVAYLICGGRVTHISPTPKQMPACQA